MAKLLPQIIAIMAVVALCNLWVPAFVPPAGQRFRSGVQVPLAGAAAMFGAAPAFADKIDDAAKTLSEKSYPFLKEIDWTSPVYGSLPANQLAVLNAVKSALKMGADIDPAALKAGVLAHVQAIASVDRKGVTSLADYTKVNAAIGHMIASTPKSEVIDVYNAFSEVAPKDVVGACMKSLVVSGDAEAWYKAFWDFKDVVAEAQR